MGESEGSRYGRAPRVFTGEEVRDSSAEGTVLQMGNSSVVGSCRRAAHGDGGGRSHRGWVVGASGRQECTGQIHRPKGLPCTSPPRLRGDGTCNDTRRYLSPGAPPAWVLQRRGLLLLRRGGSQSGGDRHTEKSPGEGVAATAAEVPVPS
jgi:hypothetical protein